jgi:hypothetical protein
MEETDSKVSLIPDFISNWWNTHRSFAYFMEKKVQMTSFEAIFLRFSEIIKKKQ